MTFKNTKRSKQTQSGFTLMEVMVASALIGVLAVALSNQSQLVFNSKRDSSAQTVLNGLVDRVSFELSRKETCSNANNFGGKAIARVFASGESIFAGDGTTPIITVGGEYGHKDVTTSSATSSNVIKVSAIETKVNPDDSNQMIIEITFNKRRGAMSVFNSLIGIKERIPITIFKNAITPTVIDFCYNDLTNAIATAIRMSCNGNTSYYDSTQNAPYGQCLHNVDNTSCYNVTIPSTRNKFINRLEYDSTQHKLVRTCGGLQTSCPISGQVVTGFNIDGTVICDYPLPKCAAGQLMVKNGSSYSCLNNTAGCSGLYGIRSISGSGVVCAPFFPPQTCTGLVQSTSPTGMTCSTFVKNVNCGVGEFVSSFDSSGNGICTRFINYPFSCPANYGAVGVLPNGDLNCQELTRRTMCNGSYSPTAKTQKDCTNAGGTVVSGYCKMNAVSNACPSGWTQCLAYRQTQSATCTDTNSACTNSTMQTHTVSGALYNNPVNQQTVTCDHWARNSGPWVRSCTKVVGGGPTATTPVQIVGCY
jgi:prepilin-type N-terminal cleavage/methylation domain-containing protein